MFSWVNDNTRQFMANGYTEKDQTPEDLVGFLSDAFGDRLIKMGMEAEKAWGISERFYEYLGKGYFSQSTPIWCNYGRERGLPIACNGSYIPDSIEGMKYKDAEIAIMSKHGAGTSAYIGDVRGRGSEFFGGGYADGVSLPALMLQTTVGSISQGSSRRGNTALYYPIDGADFYEFMSFREHKSPIQTVSLAVNVTDQHMHKVKDGDQDSVDRHKAVIQKRMQTGYPYIFFVDTANRNKPVWYKDHPILASNLCAETSIPSSELESFVCCLLSMNAAKYDEWKDTDAVEVATIFLDTVIEEYIEKASKMRFMDAAVEFARNHRALGIGVLGYHDYLQSKMLPFASEEARKINIEIHQTIQDRTDKASRQLAEWFGEAPVCKGYGRRNATLMAIAPTTSSSFILGDTSSGIEPLNSNYFVKDLAKGSFISKNKALKKLLASMGRDTDDVWHSIRDNSGSVQHLDFLSAHEKEVFKTFGEIDQEEIITQAADRQEYIDQSQSLNLMIPHDASVAYVNKLIFMAWEGGVKSLYYQRSTSPVKELSRSMSSSCVACEV